MENEIYKLALGAILRHFLTIVAGMLAPYGVNEAMQGQLTEATAALGVSIILAGFAFALSYAQKRFSINLTEAAHRAQPDTPMEFIKIAAQKRTRKNETVKRSIGLLLICSFAVTLTACPRAKIERSIRTAKEQSAIIKINAEKIIQANIDAFRAKEISKPTFAELTALTGKLTGGIEAYSKAVKNAEKLFKENQAPPDILSTLSKMFSEEVSAVFFALTEKLKILSPAQNETLKTIMSAIRLAILAIQAAIAEGFQIQKEIRA